MNAVAAPFEAVEEVRSAEPSADLPDEKVRGHLANQARKGGLLRTLTMWVLESGVEGETSGQDAPIVTSRPLR